MHNTFIDPVGGLLTRFVGILLAFVVVFVVLNTWYVIEGGGTKHGLVQAFNVGLSLAIGWWLSKLTNWQPGPSMVRRRLNRIKERSTEYIVKEEADDALADLVDIEGLSIRGEADGRFVNPGVVSDD